MSTGKLIHTNDCPFRIKTTNIITFCLFFYLFVELYFSRIWRYYCDKRNRVFIFDMCDAAYELHLRIFDHECWFNSLGNRKRLKRTELLDIYDSQVNMDLINEVGRH